MDIPLLGGAGMAQWCRPLAPHTNVAQVRFPVPLSVYMSAEFVVGSRSCSKGFSPGSQSTNTNISKFDLESVHKKPLCGDATAKFQFIFIYLFYFISFYVILVNMMFSGVTDSGN